MKWRLVVISPVMRGAGYGAWMRFRNGALKPIKRGPSTVLDRRQVDAIVAEHRRAGRPVDWLNVQEPTE